MFDCCNRAINAEETKKKPIAIMKPSYTHIQRPININYIAMIQWRRKEYIKNKKLKLHSCDIKSSKVKKKNERTISFRKWICLFGKIKRKKKTPHSSHTGNVKKKTDERMKKKRLYLLKFVVIYNLSNNSHNLKQKGTKKYIYKTFRFHYFNER